MSKVKRIGISCVADGVALKTIPLTLVRNPQLHSRSSLKPQRLLVDSYPFARHPHILCLFVELIQELLNLPQRIHILIFTWAFAVVGYCKLAAEVLPATSRFDSLARCRVLPPEGGADEVTTKQWLLVLGAKPVIDFGVRSFAKSTPNILYISLLSKEKKSVYSPLPAPFA